MERKNDFEIEIDSNILSANPSVVGPVNTDIVLFKDENAEHNQIVEFEPVDYTHLFVTDERFSSRQMLIDWVRARGIENDMVIILRRSDSGVVRSTQATRHIINSSPQENVDNVPKPKIRKQTGSKKLGCPFALRGREVSVGEWTLVVKCGVHNHDLGVYAEGHLYVGRLSKVEEEYVVDMTHANSRPKDILANLQEKFKGNKSTVRTIYNARLKHRVISREGRSQMQQLMFMLEKHQYVHHHRRCKETNTAKDLFFAHPRSIDLLRAFSNVILMDCTYKTNRYKLPLLEIVGVTSTNKTFLIAAAYLEHEKTDNYVWACSCLKSLMEEWCMPTVILTDREIALMNALERAFPTSRHFLCRWHISKNILVNCRKLFVTKQKWDKFVMFWNMLVDECTELNFNESLQRLKSDYKEYPRVLEYVEAQWIKPYKERFVSCWTDTVMH